MDISLKRPISLRLHVITPVYCYRGILVTGKGTLWGCRSRSAFCTEAAA